MREETTTRTLYQFEELSERAQEKALQELWDINMDHEWWDCVTEDINEFGKVSGLGCEYGKEFDCDRGRYIAIENICVGARELFEKASAVQDFPNIFKEVYEPFLGQFSERDRRNLERLERVQALGCLTGRTGRRGVSADVEAWTNSEHTRCNALIDRLQEAWKQFLRDLEHAYVTMLDREYEYQTSEERVKESILANGYEFEEDGSFA